MRGRNQAAVPRDDYVNISRSLVSFGIWPHGLFKLGPGLPVKAEANATPATMANVSPGFDNFCPLFMNGSLLQSLEAVLGWLSPMARQTCATFALSKLVSHDRYLPFLGADPAATPLG